MAIEIVDNIKLNTTSSLLIVDDDPKVVDSLEEMLENENYKLTTAYSVAEAISIINRQNVNIVLSDLILGDGTGIEILKEARNLHPDSEVIVMTGQPTIQNAVDVIKQGAYDYIVKPFAIETVKLTLGRAAVKIRLEQENIKLKELMSFYQISEAMGSIIELDALFDLILNTVVKEYEADAATIFCMPEEISGLELKSEVGLENNEYREMVIRHCLEISRKAMEGTSPILFANPDVELDWEEKTIKSSMCQPLLVKGKILGTLNVIRIKNNHPFTHGQLTGLAILSSKAATALENSNLYESLKRTYFSTVEALANAVEARDSYTRGHTERVYFLSRAIAQELGWADEQLGDLKIGALLHDIGKIGVPDSILNKPAPLTPDELEIMKKHPAMGAKMVEAIPFLRQAIPYILYHHERHDGTGYPTGLSGDQIPFPGRLLAVVDTIDAITSDRPYRKGRSIEAALEEIKQYSGTQFNPVVVDACFSAFAKGKLDFLFKKATFSLPKFFGISGSPLTE